MSPEQLTWQAAALRLALTVAAGGVVGFNRGEHGQVAGLRTVILVSVAACLAMLQVNALLPLAGKPSTSFVVMDLMRLPLGILSGMGFIGAGAIVRRGSVVAGVTTAATLWLMTTIGLCFGGGQLALGGVGTGIAVVVLWGLRPVDAKLPREQRATLVVVARTTDHLDERVRSALVRAHFEGAYHGGVYRDDGRVELEYGVRWRGDSVSVEPSELVALLSKCPGVELVRWHADGGDEKTSSSEWIGPGDG